VVAINHGTMTMEVYESCCSSDVVCVNEIFRAGGKVYVQSLRLQKMWPYYSNLQPLHGR
jgi:hypothetical protein